MSPSCFNEPRPQDGFVQPADDEVGIDPGAVVTDEQNYGYEEYEDEQEEY